MLLDDINLEILDLLQHDGRMSYRDLADHVGLTPPAVTDRVKKLEAAGVIRGYRAAIDYSKVGLQLLCVIRLNQTRNQADLDEVLRSNPEIIEAIRVTGSESHVIRARVRDTAHLEDLLQRFWDFADSITNIATSAPVPHRPVPIAALIRPE